ncbi:hypothetical protein [Cyclonatronum proteinivorum]|uniref:hypothetical protein n=1 Tax=Cyclonatronum proteinivorum TaxID=1457365 RepID=UPI0013DEC831|nr:hypothetical protein [Cyclonatronum proteinivorum]
MQNQTGCNGEQISLIKYFKITKIQIKDLRTNQNPHTKPHKPNPKGYGGNSSGNGSSSCNAKPHTEPQSPATKRTGMPRLLFFWVKLREHQGRTDRLTPPKSKINALLFFLSRRQISDRRPPTADRRLQIAEKTGLNLPNSVSKVCTVF